MVYQEMSKHSFYLQVPLNEIKRPKMRIFAIVIYRHNRYADERSNVCTFVIKKN